MIRALILGAATAGLFLTALLNGAAQSDVAAEADTAAGAGDDWRAPGGDAGKTHYSRLGDITPANVGTLGFAWSYDLGTNRGQEATPVVIDGVMYTSGNLGRVYALDAASGRELWTFTPAVDMQVNRAACCDQANRGVAVAGGRVFVAALDGWLYALDAKSGAVAWKVDTIADRTRGYSITGAPEVAGDLIVIGNAGAEYDTRGYVTAYRLADGGKAWQVFTVPHDPKTGPQETAALEAAVKTWDPASRWDIGGGGTAWDAIAFDVAYDTIYVGVGNGGPYSIALRSPKGGDNLYLSSIVALDRRTGRVKWHYQETPGDSWDYTASQPMILAYLAMGGRRRPVILHAPKNGFLFVIDRETGRPLAVNPLVRTSWASGYDLTTGRPRMTPAGSAYWQGPKIVFPGSPGARNWFPGAWDPQRGLYFASVLDMGNLIFPTVSGRPPRRAKALNTGAALIFTPDLVDVLPTLPAAVRTAVEALPEMKWVREKPYTAEIRAIDPLTGMTVWAAPTGGWQDRGGVMATASGLVFHGMLDGRLIARDAGTGRLLKAIDTGSSIMAAPMTYRVKGVQYVAVAAGFGGGGWPYVPDYSAAYRYGNANRILVFRLGGGAVPKQETLPPLTVAAAPPPQLPGVTAATIAKGQGLFFGNCAICHANQPRSTAPDLRRLDAGVHAMFDQILLEGALVDAGMPRWDDVLSKDDVAAIHAYLKDLQAKTRTKELALKKAGKPLDTRSAAILSSY